MKKLHIVTIIFLTITTVVGIVFAAITQTVSSAKSQELAAVKNANASTQMALGTTVSAAATERYSTATAQSSLATAQSAKDTILSATMAAQASIMDSQSREVDDLRSQLANSDCASQPSSIDYSSNTSVSNSLMTWVKNSKESIDTSDWDLVWANSKTTIYKLYGQYLHVFIVFFDEPNTNSANQVFDVNFMCWLDR